MKKIFIAAFIPLLVSSCFRIASKSQDKYSAANSGISETSENSTDNNIFIIGRTFVYDVEQNEKEKSYHFIVKLTVLEGTANKDETPIEYRYFYNPKEFTPAELQKFEITRFPESGIVGDTTTINETSTGVDIHPPRAYTLKKLQLATFPNIDIPMEVGLFEISTMYIPKGNWGEWEGMKKKNRIRMDSVAYTNGLPSFGISTGRAKSEFGTNYTESHFSMDKGFVKIIFQFEDGSSVRFALREIIEPE